MPVEKENRDWPASPRRLNRSAAFPGRVMEKVESVNSASAQQQQSVDNMGKAIVGMEQVTQNIAACAEENASASEELRTQAATLRHVATDLEVMVG